MPLTPDLTLQLPYFRLNWVQELRPLKTLPKQMIEISCQDECCPQRKRKGGSCFSKHYGSTPEKLQNRKNKTVSKSKGFSGPLCEFSPTPSKFKKIFCKIGLRAGIVAKQIKPPLGTLTSHVGVKFHYLCFPSNFLLVHPKRQLIFDGSCGSFPT